MARKKTRRRRTAAQLRSYRSRVGKRTASRRRRDSKGRFLNPFDTKGFWHKSSGKYGTPPNRGGRPAKRRSAFTSRVAAGRRRTAKGRFRNPTSNMDLVLANPFGEFETFENPFTDSQGRRRRNDGRFTKVGARKRKASKSRKRSSAAKRRRRDSQGRFLNPSRRRKTRRTRRYANPFTDRRGRVHRNDGKFAKTRKRKARKSMSKRAVAARRAAKRRNRTASGRFKNPFAKRAKRMYNPSRRRALPRSRSRR